ncbi:MAG: gamma-glutamyl-gamma-aminobutyrate hydrolase family protein [Janthinobacterium lividum]
MSDPLHPSQPPSPANPAPVSSERDGKPVDPVIDVATDAVPVAGSDIADTSLAAAISQEPAPTVVGPIPATATPPTVTSNAPDAESAIEASTEPLPEAATGPSADAIAEPTTPPFAEPSPVEAATVGDAPAFGAAPSYEHGAAPAYMRPGDSALSVLGRIATARLRAMYERASHRITRRTLRIGISARIFHPEPGAKGLRGKTLQYLEESVAHWVMSRDVLVFMIPTVGQQGMLHPSNIRLRDYAKHLDALVLQGGADVSPQSYAQTVTRPEWQGDRVRDMYELELLHEFIENGKPVLGVCRGCQLINVAFGGTLYQDIATDKPDAALHVSDDYDQLSHGILFPPGSSMSALFAGRTEARVNSIHHQAVHTLGRDLSVEAVSAADGIIEAVRHRTAPFVMGVQWHPEFHRAGGAELLDCTPLLDAFLRAARDTRF